MALVEGGNKVLKMSSKLTRGSVGPPFLSGAWKYSSLLGSVLWYGYYNTLIDKVSYIFSGSASTSATCWWSAEFSVWTLWMFLLHVSVQGGIAKIRLVAVLALEVTAVNIVFRTTFRVLLIVHGAASIIWSIFIFRTLINLSSLHRLISLMRLALIWVHLLHIRALNQVARRRHKMHAIKIGTTWVLEILAIEFR